MTVTKKGHPSCGWEENARHLSIFGCSELKDKSNSLINNDSRNIKIMPIAWKTIIWMDECKILILEMHSQQIWN